LRQDARSSEAEADARNQSVAVRKFLASSARCIQCLLAEDDFAVFHLEPCWRPSKTPSKENDMRSKLKLTFYSIVFGILSLVLMTGCFNSNGKTWHPF